MFGLFKKVEAKSPAYQDGQVWVIKSGVYKGVEVVIAHVEDHPLQKEVIHIMVLGPIQNSDGLVTSDMSHLPFAKEGLQKSGLKFTRKGVDVADDWREGYGIWNEAASEGKAGIFSISVSEVIDIAFSQMPPPVGPETQMMDPNEIAFSDYQHESFSDAFLNRIKVTTDAFEEIDGVSFKQAVDLYRRDFDPESNIVIWEEMVRVYNIYCGKNSPTLATKKDVYNTLLLASMFPKDEVLIKVNADNLSDKDIEQLVSSYSLAPEPIGVYKD
jgi:hypothetical protein